MRARVRMAGLLVAGGVLVLPGCSRPATETAGEDRPTAPATPSTSSAGTTPSPTPTPRPKLKPGGKGEHVKALQRRLEELGYAPGRVDGRYGITTQMAVWAFQKVNRIKVSNTVGERVWEALDRPRAPRPMAKKREPDRVDVDLRRQYLVVYKDGRPALISHISSGSGELFCSNDPGSSTPRCRYATTSTGDFRTGRRASGWETSPLGRLYNPIYFNGGIAFHGALDVPRYPASHGCVRLPMNVAEDFPKLVGTNVPVHVRRPT
ncbi:Putative peptidoglycan binding domain-containing protein [Thermomonospora echinospora]|uniref:Putative peptidoglycan binding domain-containing protein n=1 Tax=Thermomonospora echinospora TaxID=1992 RepID=A0A1H5SCJ0_9ACTN|nr:L,D-transpeptidase family protein [Thermomonospora echinospora]SEF48150.1 Putative peptidoglycan binding domain-containing protein [Thermomonospora echinospora]